MELLSCGYCSFLAEFEPLKVFQEKMPGANRHLQYWLLEGG